MLQVAKDGQHDSLVKILLLRTTLCKKKSLSFQRILVLGDLLFA